MLDLSDNSVIFDTAKSVLESVADALTGCQFDVPSCRFIGFNRPSELTCPDLVGWANNVRVWDGENMNGGLRDGYIRCHVGYAFDVTIRLGVCYVEMDENGRDIDHEVLEAWSKELYQMAHVMYVGWVARFKSGKVSALGNCDPVDLSALTDYKEGGCAGWEFTISVGLWS